MTRAQAAGEASGSVTHGANAVRRANPIPAPSLLEALPTGHVAFAGLDALVGRLVQLLGGRPWVLVQAVAAYDGFDTTPIVNVWTEPPPGRPRVEWLACAVLGDLADLPTLERALQVATGRRSPSSSAPQAGVRAMQDGAAA